MSEIIVDIGILKLNGETYKMVPPQNEQIPYEIEYVSGAPYHNPYSRNIPAEVSVNGFTWHLGGFKSRDGAVGTSEYGENTDGSSLLELLPGPKVNTITLNDSLTMEVNHIFNNTASIGPYVWVAAGRYIFRIDTSSNAVASKDLGVGVNAVQTFVGLDGNIYVVTDAATLSLWKLSAIVVGGPDTWTQTADVAGCRFAVGINRTFKITTAGVLSNCRAGLDIMVNSNWGDAVQIGSSSLTPQALVAYERTVLVGKTDGLFSVGEEGFGVPEIKRMGASTNNTHAMLIFDPFLMVPHARGLFRWAPGEAVPSGLETEKLNQSPVRGPICALATDSEWIYFFIQVGATLWLNRMRERRRNEQVSGTYVLDTWVQQTGLSGNCNWAHFVPGVPASSLPARLFWGVGKKVYYIDLGTGAGVSDTLDPLYRFTTTSGTRYSAKMNFDDRNPKDFRRIQVDVDNVDVNKYWSVAYSVDGGAWQTTDILGAAMSAVTNGLTTFYLPVTANGREIQLRFTFVNNSETSPPKLKYYEVSAVPKPTKVARIMVTLLLGAGFQTESGYESRTAIEQQNALQALLVSSVPVTAIGPWGEELVVVQDMALTSAVQEGNEPYSFLAKVTLQGRPSV